LAQTIEMKIYVGVRQEIHVWVAFASRDVYAAIALCAIVSAMNRGTIGNSLSYEGF